MYTLCGICRDLKSFLVPRVKDVMLSSVFSTLHNVQVTQRSTGRVMVLKRNRFIDSQNRARNLTEIEVTRTLDHKNVLKYQIYLL